MDGKTVFHERQRMLQPWASAALIVIMLLIESLMLMGFLGYVRIDQTDIVTLVIVTGVVVLVIGLALLLKMDVEVDEKFLRIKTIGTREIGLDDIVEARVRDKIYAVHEYGGWGIRLWTKGLGYIAPGNNGGVEILIRGSKHGIMISSGDPEALLDAIS